MFEKELTLFTDKKYENKEEFFVEMANLVEHKVTDRETYKDAVKTREATFNTYIGYDVAIPHAKTDAVKEPFVIYTKIKDGLVWGESGEPAKHVFMIGVPMEAASNLHLKIISELSKRVMRDEWRQHFMNVESSEEAYEILKLIEKEIKA